MSLLVFLLEIFAYVELVCLMYLSVLSTPLEYSIDVSLADAFIIHFEKVLKRNNPSFLLIKVLVQRVDLLLHKGLLLKASTELFHLHLALATSQCFVVAYYFKYVFFAGYLPVEDQHSFLT